MAFAIFALFLIASLVIAILSKRGAVSSDMGDVMTAGGSFGAFLVFFISVGEILKNNIAFRKNLHDTKRLIIVEFTVVFK